MDRLWAPWRLAYVTAPRAPDSEAEACFICQAVQGSDDRTNLVVLRTPHSIVILNRFPYNNGHLLVAPRAHKSKLGDLDPAETLDLMQTVPRMTDWLDRLMRPEGYNVGLNLGKVAGAGLPGHLHWHVVPRWNGDTNFMSILSDARVMAQSLDALYDLLTTHG